MELARHWDDVYERVGETEVSWHELGAVTSLEVIDAAGIRHDDPIIDIGGGSSTLVEGLLGRGFRDVSVLDVSTAGLSLAKERFGAAADEVHWLNSDLLAWQPTRRYQVWHDRAMFHFLVEEADSQRYASILKSALDIDGVAIIATFAPDGPEMCSGLRCARYSPHELTETLGLELRDQRRQEHVTPNGIIQPFTWVIATSHKQ